MPFKRNVRTGEIVEVDASGRPVGRAGPPASPTFPFEGQKIQTEIGQGQAGTARTRVQTQGDLIDNSTKGATQPYLIRQAAAKTVQDEAAAAEARQKLDKFNQARTGALSGLQTGIGAIDDVSRHLRDTGGMWELGKSGSWARAGGTDPGDWLYSGTDAADFDAMTNPIVANTAFDKIMQMRTNSPTGAGLGGNTSDKDVELLKSSTADLKPTQSVEGYRRSLRTARNAYVRNLRGIDPAAARGAVGSNPDLTPDGAMEGIRQGYQSLTQQMQGKTPAQRQAMLRAFNNDPGITALKSRAGFRDPGGTRGAPRKAPTGGAKFLGFE